MADSLNKAEEKRTSYTETPENAKKTTLDEKDLSKKSSSTKDEEQPEPVLFSVLYCTFWAETSAKASRNQHDFR